MAARASWRRRGHDVSCSRSTPASALPCTAPASSASRPSTNSTFRATPSSAPRTPPGSSRPTAARSPSTPIASTPPIVDRAAFDQALADRAAAPPAPNCAATRACARSRSPTAASRSRPTATPPIDARACILACGANYRFNRAARSRRAARASCRARSSSSRSPARAGRSAPGPRGRAARLRLARAVSARRPPLPRLGLMCDARARRRSSARSPRGCATRFGIGDDAVARAAPQDPAARSGVADLRPAPARRRRRGRPRQADHRRRHLLQPDQRPARGRDARRGAARRRSARVRLRRTKPAGAIALGAEIRIGLAFRMLAARMNDRASTPSSSSPASTASSRCCARPPTSTGTASPRSPCCDTRSSAGFSSRLSGADTRSNPPMNPDRLASRAATTRASRSSAAAASSPGAMAAGSIWRGSS